MPSDPSSRVAGTGHETRNDDMQVAAMRPRHRRVAVPHWLAVLVSDRRAAVGVGLLTFFVALVVIGPLIWTGNAVRIGHAPQLAAPSGAHWFGTDRFGRDIFLQVINGGRSSLKVGFLVGFVVTTICVGVGISAGYFGGWIDEVLSMITNIFLVIPQLPLQIAIASFVTFKGDSLVIGVLTLTGWPFGARVLRSQTMSIRAKDFVLAAAVAGESGTRIVWLEILPNMISLVVSTFFGATMMGITSSATLQFLGYGVDQSMSWGVILNTASNSSAALSGYWWTYIFAGMCIVLVATSMILINFGIDAISNPRLHVQKRVMNRGPAAPTPGPQIIAA